MKPPLRAPRAYHDQTATKADASVSQGRPRSRSEGASLGTEPLNSITPAQSGWTNTICELSDAAAADVAQSCSAPGCLTPSGSTHALTINKMHTCSACFAHGGYEVIRLLNCSTWHRLCGGYNCDEESNSD